MDNEIKKILTNIEKSQEEIKEMIIKTSINNKKINDELLSIIKELKRR